MKMALTVVLLALGIAGASFAQDNAPMGRMKIAVFSVVPDATNVDMVSFDQQLVDGAIYGAFTNLGRFDTFFNRPRVYGAKAVEEYIAAIAACRRSNDLLPLFSSNYILSPQDAEKLIGADIIVCTVVSNFSISGYQVSTHDQNSKSGVSTTSSYQTIAMFSIRFYNLVKGSMDVLNFDIKGDGNLPGESFKKAMGNFSAAFSMAIRKMDQFRLKANVLKTVEGMIFSDLNSNLGLKAGYEFAFDNGKGLARVRSVNEKGSIIIPVFGMPNPGDTLIETPMANARINPFLEFYSLFDTAGNLYYFPTAGVAMEAELGYDGIVEARLAIPLFRTYYIGSSIPLVIPMLAEIGAGGEFYFGAISLQLTGLLGLGGSGYYISDANKRFDLSDLYAKLKAGINVQFSQNFKMRFSVAGMGGWDILHGTLYAGPATSLELVFRM